MNDLVITRLHSELRGENAAQYSGKTPEQIAELVNNGWDISPESVSSTRIVERRIGFGAVMAALGATEGGQVLDTIEAAAQGGGPLKWAFKLLQAGELDVGNAQTREQIDQLQAVGLFMPAQATALKALAEVQDAQVVGAKRSDAPVARVIWQIPGAPNTITAADVVAAQGA